MKHYFIKPLLIFGFLTIFLSIPLLAGYETRKISDNNDILQDLNADQIFVFFGFPACSDVCPTTLATFSRALKQHSNPRISFLFVDIDPTSSASLAEEYASSFHPDIHSIATSNDGYKHLLSSLGERTQINGSSIKHAGNVYMLRNNPPDWVVEEVIPASQLTTSRLTALMTLE